MIQITSVEYITRHKMRVSLNGEPAFIITDKDAAEWQLAEGVELDEEQAEELTGFVGRLAARTAMDLLVRRDYSEAELRRKLREKGFNEMFAEEGIAYVRSYRYLDDERYARQYIESRKRTNSRKMMTYKLREKGVADSVIQSVLEDVCWDDAEGIRCEIRKRFYSMNKLSEISEKEKQKLYQSLMRKGYDYQDIRYVLKEIVTKF